MPYFASPVMDAHTSSQWQDLLTLQQQTQQPHSPTIYQHPPSPFEDHHSQHQGMQQQFDYIGTPQQSPIYNYDQSFAGGYFSGASSVESTPAFSPFEMNSSHMQQQQQPQRQRLMRSTTMPHALDMLPPDLVLPSQPSLQVNFKDVQQDFSNPAGRYYNQFNHSDLSLASAPRSSSSQFVATSPLDAGVIDGDNEVENRRESDNYASSLEGEIKSALRERSVGRRSPVSDAKASSSRGKISKKEDDTRSEKLKDSRYIHSFVERRYRQNLNSRFDALRCALVDAHKSSTALTALSTHSEKGTSKVDIVLSSSGTELLGSRKADVLGAATNYIRDAERSKGILLQQIALLQERVNSMEKMQH